MSITRAGIASIVVLGGAILFGKHVVSEHNPSNYRFLERPFSEYNLPEFRILGKHDTEEPKNFISYKEARNLISAEFALNQNNKLTKEGQRQAVNFVANIIRHTQKAVPLTWNNSDLRRNLFIALRDMSQEPKSIFKDVPENLANENR